MTDKKKIIGICGSATRNSSNLAILRYIAELQNTGLELEIIDDLTVFPHFRTELTDTNIPAEILDFRNKVELAAGVIICTPEYIFSIPSAVKNLLEWSVSTTIWSGKPTGIITASASGEMGHQELQFILKTVESKFTPETTLLIQGVKGKISSQGEITDKTTENELKNFVQAFVKLIG